MLEIQGKDGIVGVMKLNSYQITLTDNTDGIIITANDLTNLFKKLDHFMSRNCYYIDDIISIQKLA